MIYPPPYERHFFHYDHANVDSISTAFEGFDCNKDFSNKDIDRKVSIFTTILSIMNNFVNDKDPLWIYNKIKTLIKEKGIFEEISQNKK